LRWQLNGEEEMARKEIGCDKEDFMFAAVTVRLV
jgi:hypothetical protein